MHFPGYNFPDGLTGLSALANLESFPVFKLAATAFSNERKRERAAAITAGEGGTSSSEVEELSQLLFVCLASGVDDQAKCTYLVQAGASMRFVSASRPGFRLQSMLVRAVQSGKPALVRLLLSVNAPVDNVGLPGDPPVCLAVGVKTAGLSILELLHEYNANFKMTNHYESLTPFELAVRENDHAMVKFIAKVGGATNLASVASRVVNHCTKSPRCNGDNCNPAMLLTLIDLGAEVKRVKRHDAAWEKFDGTVHMCVQGHMDLDHVLRKRFEDTTFVLMMGLFSKRRGPESFKQVNVLDDEVCTMIFKSVFCDRERHPLVIKDGALVERECSLHLCGRHVKDPKFPFSVLTVPRTSHCSFVFEERHVEDKDAQLPTEAELAELAELAEGSE
jgi:hypothetical protein